MPIVFLQDAVILIEDYPGFGLFQHKVFKHPLWEEIKEGSQTLMKGLECVAAFKPVSRSHAPEIQAELEQPHSCFRKAQAENEGIKNEVARLTSQLAVLNQNMTLQVKTMSSTLSLVQKQNALFVQKANDKLDKLLGSASSVSTRRIIEPGTCSNAASSSEPEEKRTPAKRRRFAPAEASAQRVLDLNVSTIVSARRP